AATPPAIEERAAPALAPATSARLTAGLRVLVVEDDRDSRELVEALLSERGADVTAVESVTDAIAAFDAAVPDVVLSDIAMHGRDGYALIQWIREQPGEPGDVPAIALTAYAGEADRKRVMAAGFQAFVAKPFDSDMLIATVTSVARRAPGA
ncbi:MAG: response regulator, partial [Acidobacteriota bacterium]|nr:response regulator [Acidobacteriota bacterium]